MCNLYKMDKSAAEVVRWFNAISAEPGNARPEVYPGYPGYVMAEGRVRQLTWGFPLSLKGKNGQALKPKPVKTPARTSSTASCGASASQSGGASSR